jgi:hypothetical protein
MKVSARLAMLRNRQKGGRAAWAVVHDRERMSY